MSETTMKNQINILNQLQELVLTRDEHRQSRAGTGVDALNRSIDALEGQLELQPRMAYQRLYKKDHVVMSPMVDGCCGVCGMRLPVAQMQQVRLARAIQTCSSCGRILFEGGEDAPRTIASKPARGEPRKTGVSRFSAEELMVCDLKGDTPQAAVQELAELMAANRFVSNADALTEAAMERESLMSTAMDNGLSFPHVRGVEGGGLTLALGVSRKGLEWDEQGRKVNLVFFSVIPVAVSAFYLRLMAGLGESFAKSENRELLMGAKTPAELWKAFTRATRHSIR